MDRNFERVYQAIIRDNGECIQLTREFMAYAGYHKPCEDLNPEKQKRIIYDSLWKRFQFDRLRSNHANLAVYLLSSLVLFKVNLIPRLYTVMNAVLPDEFEELESQDVISKKLVEHLEAYLLWKSDVDESELPGVQCITFLLEAQMIVELTAKAVKYPGADDDLHQWLFIRQGDIYATKPTLQT